MLNNPYRSGAAPHGGYPGFPPGQAGSPQSGGVGMPGGLPQTGQYPPQMPSGSYMPGMPGMPGVQGWQGQGQGQGQAQAQGPGPGAGQGQGQGQQVTPGLLPLEQSYIENILRLNLGKIATIYMTYENNSQWNAKIFKGRLEAAGRDHIIISDPKTGMRFLLLMVNLDYITFDEELNYSYPYGNLPTRR
jgi:spore germination protein Q